MTPRNTSWGSVVTLPETIHKGILLDGQQRLATLTILLSLMRDELHQRAAVESATELAEYIQASLIALPVHATSRYRLTLNREDSRFFRELVQEPTSSHTRPTLESHRRIASARRLLKKHLVEYLRGSTPEEAISRLATLLARIETISFL